MADKMPKVMKYLVYGNVQLLMPISGAGQVNGSINPEEHGYFIRISEECYHHWRLAKQEMDIKNDEDLIYHFLNLKKRTLSIKLE